MKKKNSCLKLIKMRIVLLCIVLLLENVVHFINVIKRIGNLTAYLRIFC